MEKKCHFYHFLATRGGVPEKPQKTVKKHDFLSFFGFRMFIHNDTGFRDRPKRRGGLTCCWLSEWWQLILTI